MAKRRASSADDITLYDIDPVFQDKLIAWLTQKPKGVVVDIGATPEAFTITLDPGGTFLDESFEHVLSASMGSRSKKKYIDPELENRIHMFLHAAKARLTFGASKDGVFNMTVSNPDSRGTASDEDFEFALVIAEEKFWENMPARPKVPIVTVPAPMISPEARGAMLDETLPPGMAQYFQPRPTLSLPARPSLPPAPAQTPGGFVGAWQPPAARPAPARPALPAPKPKPKPKSTPLKFPLVSPAVPVMTSLGQAPSFFGGSTPPPGQFISKNARRPPPPPSSRPFDPSVPPVRYAKPHHFAVNPPTYSQEPSGYVLRKSSRWSAGRQLPYQGPSAREVGVVPQVYGSWEAAKRDADRMLNPVGFEVVAIDQSGFEIEPSAGSPHGRMRENHAGAWRIHLAGGDVARGAHADYDEAAQEARHTYGPSGWTVEWHAAGR